MNKIITDITLPEVFAKVSSQKSTNDKINVLKLYDSKALRWFVYSMYNIKWDLEIPEYKVPTSPPGLTYSSISKSLLRLDLIEKLKDSEKLQDKDKLEKQLILVLENVSKDESELLVNLFSGSRKVEGIPKTVFRGVYPDFFTQDGSEDL
jgi:hypothetical protein